ncbi:MAG: 2-amino-4-hydroxy-6-hydroxymethyldihydropteridine diphosphokinase [Tannerella sp.]|nr:2-amino-4-hydroxy-6-hydroxymethyldihydropteridine diphosphokinase [Tannerella sp.]
MSQVFLGLGSNLGNRRDNMEKALALIAGRVGEILALSGFYETPPWGYESAESYLNAVVKVETGLSPSVLLSVTRAIERETGRKEKTVNGAYRDRIMDIDILLYDDLVMQTPELTIPHPFMHRRQFVMQPLAEIAPGAIHPVSGRTMTELYRSFQKNAAPL